MAPIKLEDHIREQMEEREIAPSAAAWDKLATQLDKNQDKKRPVFIWYAVAASVVGMLFVASQFFGNDTVDVAPNLVEQELTVPVSKEQEIHSEMLKNETQLAEEKVVQDVVEHNKPEQVQVAKKESSIRNTVSPVIDKKKKVVVKEDATRVAVQEQKEASSQDISEAINKEMVFSNKVEEVVAAVQKIKEEQNTVSAEEIDQLLRNAQQDLATQRILNETEIDAMALLNDVEFELEKSFRDKVFDALGDSFSKIKTAVVERNN
ncbi:hypothetical protein SCB49_09145 [unidentified eubacterium SCB49]|nr:hypothetical protein SCB49_09145 [unidentified eubacterium SCB49]